jgi:hypothetical protein
VSFLNGQQPFGLEKMGRELSRVPVAERFKANDIKRLKRVG